MNITLEEAASLPSFPKLSNDIRGGFYSIKFGQEAEQHAVSANIEYENWFTTPVCCGTLSDTLLLTCATTQALDEALILDFTRSVVHHLQVTISVSRLLSLPPSH